MKQILILCDGMADYPLEQLGSKTPMEAAHKPNMEFLAKHGRTGLVKTVADDQKPGSDVANLSVLGYDPKVYYAGRSPLEAASIGIDLSDTDVTLRCNLVTLSDEPEYNDKTILDYCADDISTEEAEEIIKTVQQAFGNEEFAFYTGVSYRHCLVWKNGTTELGTVTPPHDITGRAIAPHLPTDQNAAKLLEMMRASYSLLKDHPVNRKRIATGHRPANAIWLWGEGRKKPLMPFEEKYGVKGSMISAVDLLKGIGKLTGMNVVEVPGTTGYIDTNFAGKAQAAIDELKNGQDFVYVHIEAPDECGHRAELENKIKAIEIIDSEVIGPILKAMEGFGDYKVMVLPDHATPIALKTHTSDPVPFLMYSTAHPCKTEITIFCEKDAAKTGDLINEGHTIMEQFMAF